VRALVIGRGAMGKRRIRDLTKLGVEVESWDKTDGEMMPDGPYESVIVSTPPATHGSGAGWASHDGAPCFTEADCVMIPQPHFPSCTPRFVPAIVRTRERIARGDIGAPVAYTLHVGQNLLDWHPGADLLTYYAAQRKTGACREMVPFELGWLTWVFGPVTKAKALRANTANLADIDDVYQVVLQHEQPEKGSAPVLGHLLIDVVSRPAIRRLQVVGTAGSFTTDIRYTEAVYLAEMRAFVKSVEEGEAWPFSLAEEKHCLDVLASLENCS
jgi:predicted dehydrogenase